MLCLLISLSLSFLICTVRALGPGDSSWTPVRPGLLAQTCCLRCFRDPGLFIRRSQALPNLFPSGHITYPPHPDWGFLEESQHPQHVARLCPGRAPHGQLRSHGAGAATAPPALPGLLPGAARGPRPRRLRQSPAARQILVPALDRRNPAQDEWLLMWWGEQVELAWRSIGSGLFGPGLRVLLLQTLRVTPGREVLVSPTDGPVSFQLG